MNKKLKQLRTNTELTQAHLAHLLDTSVQYISNVENGRTKISQQQAQKWAEACGYSLETVFLKKL